MSIKIGRDITLSSEKFLQVFAITWFFIVLGSALSVVFILIAGNFQKESFFYLFIQNFGIFIFFTSLLSGYAGVYRAVNSPSETVTIRESIMDSLKRSHYVLAVALITVILFSSVVLVETGVSMVSMVPYAGAALMSLLTAPLFILNIFIVVAAICVFAIASPISSEVDGIKNVISEIRALLKNEWLNIIIYLLVSLSFFLLGIILIVFIIRYAGGITRAVQWKISIAYPPSMKNIISSSYFSDVIRRIVPGVNPMSAIQQYGNDLPDYLRAIKYIITISTILVLSLVATFPLAIYFSLSSAYFKKIWKAS